MRLIITDTNVLFDLIKIGALPEFFSLDLEICTTVFVIEEIKPPDQKDMVEAFIRAKKLTVFDFSGDDIEEVLNFNACHALKRLTDKSVLWKCHQLGCPMLTGDRKMKETAEEIGIEVHGSIWIIDELLKNDLITPEKAISLLEQLMFTNSRLPKNEIERRINKLK